MEIARYVSRLWKWWWLILTASLLAGASSYWTYSQVPPTFQTTATLQVGQFLESADPRIGDFNTSQQLAQVYAQSVTRRPILQGAIDALGLSVSWNSLASQVYASAPYGTQLVTMSVTDTDPVRAKALADEIANQLILQSPTMQDKEQEGHRRFVGDQLTGIQQRIREAEQQIEQIENQIINENSAVRIKEQQDRKAALQQQISGWQATYGSLLSFYQGGRTNYLTVVNPASIPERPIGPSTARNTLLAAVFGFLLAAGAVIVIDYLDDTLATEDDAAKTLELPTIGSIPRIDGIKAPADSLVTVGESSSPIAEAYRLLRTNIQFAYPDDDSFVLVVTSPGTREGKSVTSANLAVSLAQAGRRTIVVDADLRRPSLHTIFGINNELGLTTLFLSEPGPPPPSAPEAGPTLRTLARKNRRADLQRRIGEILVPARVPKLMILPSGAVPASPGELLGSEKMSEILELLRQRADVVILDCPPLLPLADTLGLVARSLGVVL
ncbi:MAG: tyrosine-protein kinase domain-containing protein, partial [Chloroflexota bacterium]